MIILCPFRTETRIDDDFEFTRSGTFFTSSKQRFQGLSVRVYFRPTSLNKSPRNPTIAPVCLGTVSQLPIGDGYKNGGQGEILSQTFTASSALTLVAIVVQSNRAENRTAIRNIRTINRIIIPPTIYNSITTVQRKRYEPALCGNALHFFKFRLVCPPSVAPPAEKSIKCAERHPQCTPSS